MTTEACEDCGHECDHIIHETSPKARAQGVPYVRWERCPECRNKQDPCHQTNLTHQEPVR